MSHIKNSKKSDRHDVIVVKYCEPAESKWPFELIEFCICFRVTVKYYILL